MADADPSDEEEEEHALGEDGGELLELCEQLHQQALARRVAMNAREAPQPPEFQPTQGGSTLARRLDKASSPCVYTDAPLAMALVTALARVCQVLSIYCQHRHQLLDSCGAQLPRRKRWMQS